MIADNTEIVGEILRGRDCEEKVELGTLMLELYEHVEENLIKKHGIHIRLNLYEGVNTCVYGNKFKIMLCMESLLYCFVENAPDMEVVEFVIQNTQDRAWASFKNIKSIIWNQKSAGHEKLNPAIKEYLDLRDIVLIMTQEEYKAGFVFRKMKGGK